MARFSLSQLLVFVFACCVYLSVLRITVLDGFDTPGSLGAIIFAAWVMLWPVYLVWRLPFTLVAHCFLPACVVVVFPSVLPLSWQELHPEFVWRNPNAAQWILLFVQACHVATLPSFPAAVVTISYRGLRKR